MQLEQRMNDMEKVIMELEQRYGRQKREVCSNEFPSSFVNCLYTIDYRTRNKRGNKVTNQTKT